MPARSRKPKGAFAVRRDAWLALGAIALVAALLVGLPLAIAPPGGSKDAAGDGLLRLDLHLKPAALARIGATRRRALRETHGILLTEDDDWVGGKLVTWQDGRPLQRKVELRVKGDWADHFRDTPVPSLRVKVQDGETVLGMRRFSLQAPKTRNFENEALLMDELREAGVIAPRYRFVALTINGTAVGAMALEEHFEKELVEHARRREAPILALDETDLWAQRALNRDDPERLRQASVDPNEANLVYETYPVRFFSKLDPRSATAVELTDRARGLLRGFMEGHLPADRVFDRRTAARWITILNVFGGYHGMLDHNQRFYFNPILDRLEPIAFDNDAIRRIGQKRRLKLPVEGEHLLASPEFAEEITAFAADYARRLAEPATRARLARAFEGYTRSLGRAQDFEALYATLQKRARRFEHQIAAVIPKARSTTRALGDPPQRIRRFLAAAPALARIAYAYVWRSAQGPLLEVMNLADQPLTVEAAVLDGFLGEREIPLDRTVAPYYRGGPLAARLPLAGAELDLGAKVAVRIAYRGERRLLEALWYGPPLETAQDPEVALAADQPIAGVSIEPARRTVAIAGEDVRIGRSLRFPAGFRTRVAAGTRITLADGVLLTFDGPLDLAGTPEAPVTIAMTPGASGRNRWGGLLVRRSAAPSSWRHFRILAAGGRELPERQDGHGLTGCVTFYEADLELQDGRFEDLGCEDALNVVRSRFALARVTVSGAAFDAFDSDFSAGSVADSAFLDGGNDGIDVSGSTVAVTGSRFERLGDKAISVGEGSELSAARIAVEAVPLGVVAKDLSLARVEGSSFRNVTDTVFAAYQKKPEFGPGTIVARGNTTAAVTHLWAMDERSSIELAARAGPP